jgi:superfamily II DNA or RNA helicase
MSQSDDTKAANAKKQKDAFEYEQQCIIKHRSDHKDTNYLTYHWNDIPEELLIKSGYFHSYHSIRQQRYEKKYINNYLEYGLDGLAVLKSIDENGNEIYHNFQPIQAKNYRAEKNALAARKLGTFFVSCHNIRMEYPQSIGYLYYSGKIESRLHGYFINQKQRNQFYEAIPFDFNEIVQQEEPQIAEVAEISEVAQVAASPPKINEWDLELLDHQKPAVAKLNAGWENGCSLNYPCGLGKTKILSHHLRDIAEKYDKILLLGHFCVHANDLMERVKPYLPDYESLITDSDRSTNDDVPTTTDETKIRKFWNKNKIIISSTYITAIKTISKILEEYGKPIVVNNPVNVEEDNEESDEDDNGDHEDDENNNEVGDSSHVEGSVKEEESNDDEEEKPINKLPPSVLLVIDECHNISKNKKMWDFIKKFSKYLLISATAPEEIYDNTTPITYKLSEAIKEKLICDYQIHIPLLTRRKNEDGTDDPNGEIIDDIPVELVEYEESLTRQPVIVTHSNNEDNEDNEDEVVDNVNSEYDLQENKVKKTVINSTHNKLLLKGLFLMRGMLKTGSKKCIVYLTSQEECVDFMNIIQNIAEKYHKIDVWTRKITAKTSADEREEIIDDFQKKHETKQLSILTSVYILNEGVNIVKCDSVFITSLSKYSSIIVTVQRIFRANRIDSENPNKIANAFIWAEDDNEVVNALQLLKVNGEENVFLKKVKKMGICYERETREIEIQQENIERVKTTELQDYLEVKCLTVEEMFTKKVEELKKWMDDNGGKVPSVYSNDIIEKRLGKFRSHCKENRNNNQFWPNFKENIWFEVFNSFELLQNIDKVNEFKNKLFNFKIWFENNNYNIPRTTIGTNEEKYWRKFINNCREKNINNDVAWISNNFSMLWEEIIGSTELIEEVDNFMNNLLDLKNYLENHNWIPPRQCGNDKNEIKLGRFIGKCVKDKKSGRPIWISENREKIWEEILGSTSLLQGKQDVFIIKLNKLKEWLQNNNNQSPIFNSGDTNEEELSKFISNSKSYRKRKMKGWQYTEIRENQWLSIIGSLELLEEVSIFKNNMIRLKVYLENNNNIPPRTSGKNRDEDERVSGEFLSDCKKNRNKPATYWIEENRDQQWIDIFGNLELLLERDTVLEKMRQLKKWYDDNPGKKISRSSKNENERTLAVFLNMSRSGRRLKRDSWANEIREQQWQEVFGNLSLLE